MKHTRGPWKKIAGDVQAQSIDGEWDLTICTGCDDADADLIAAAPELLMALKHLIYECGCTVKERISGHRTDCSVPIALQIVHRAEGK